MKEKEQLLDVRLKATGIGSLPHQDADAACAHLLDRYIDIPCWPQMVQTDFREGMMIQYAENLPCLTIDLSRNEISYDKSADKDKALLKFFENYSAGNLEYFSIGRRFARGFYSMLGLSASKNNKFIKGQVVGPITFLLSVAGPDGKAIIHDEMLSDAVIRGLAMKGAWQAKKIRAAGKIPVIFFDEPSLSGFGSAFVPLNREHFFDIFDKLISTIKEHDNTMIGLHCCGNSDWDMILQSDIDILSFDSFEYGKYFVLYPDRIKKFIGRGGVIAWGAVPTDAFKDDVTIDMIQDRLNVCIDELVSKGIKKELILRHSIYTPACGMGSLGIGVAEKIIDLTCELATRAGAA
ncbi:MAG: hypothetical protein MUC95_03630 [Spirochaetes bacterium]|jgi:hypothetical protein|nr:hypothetical protein [Spirochaetota bacterium]